jgi:hypothetical protein
MLKIFQAWWHVEDHIDPTDGKQFRQVMDFYTDKNVLLIKLNKNFVKLKIRSRYFTKELLFTATENSYFRVNLGDLSDWPEKTSYPHSSKCYHVKLEVDYTDIEPHIERYPAIFVYPDIFRLLGYESTYLIDGFTEPEFSITLPKGMNLRKTGIKLRNRPYDANIIFKKKCKKTQKETIMLLNFHPPYIDREDGKKTYNFLITQESHNEILNTDSDEYDVKFKVGYSTINENKYFTVTIFAFLLPFIILLDIFTNLIDFGQPLINLTYVVVLISFSTLYLTLHREGYEIPLNTWIMIAIPLSVVLFVGFDIVKAFPQILPYITHLI